MRARGCGSSQLVNLRRRLVCVIRGMTPQAMLIRDRTYNLIIILCGGGNEKTKPFFMKVNCRENLSELLGHHDNM